MTDTKLETDVEKVQKYIDTNGAIPSGVDKALFPNFKDKAGANSTDELDKAKGVVKGGGAELRAKSLGGLAMAFGVAFWML